MQTFPTIAIIGAGNMGASLISGLIQTGHPSHQLVATDPSQEKLLALHEAFQILTYEDNNLAIAKADIVIFAIKPQHFAAVAKEAKAAIQQTRPLILSIAAGIRIAHLEAWLGTGLAIVRTMPNTPAMIGAGITALFANPHVNDAQHNLAESILRSVGITVWVETESLMDSVTALSGSGPAYFFLIMEALQQAAEKAGLSTETARLLTLQTALGAARMAIESGQPLKTLRQQVTSPGGTTEKAIAVLEDHQIRALFESAFMAAKTRSEELAEFMGKG
jgi:pyrroline-5-carboxylate reductase